MGGTHCKVRWPVPSALVNSALQGGGTPIERILSRLQLDTILIHSPRCCLLAASNKSAMLRILVLKPIKTLVISRAHKTIHDLPYTTRPAVSAPCRTPSLQATPAYSRFPENAKLIQRRPSPPLVPEELAAGFRILCPLLFSPPPTGKDYSLLWFPQKLTHSSSTTLKKLSGCSADSPQWRVRRSRQGGHPGPGKA